MRVVLDTNVILASFAAQGLCHLIFETVIAHHELIISHGLLSEVVKNLEKKVNLPTERVKAIVSFLKNHSTLTHDRSVAGVHCRDKSDLKILYLAIHGKVDALVTGDKDLLVLKSVKGIPIITPREFWGMLKIRS